MMCFAGRGAYTFALAPNKRKKEWETMVDHTASAARSPRVFYVGMSVTLLFVASAGFLPGYRALLAGRTTMPPFVHIHAALFLCWMLLLIAQTSLIARGSVALHRRLGALATLLIPVVLVLGYQTAIFGAQHGHPMWKAPGQFVPPGFPFANSLEFLTVPLGDLVVFAGFAIAALYFRKRPELHKRLMILATVGGLMPPAVTRLPYGSNILLTLAVLLLLIAACLAHDAYERGRLHRANVVGGLLILASVPVRLPIAKTEAWHQIAAWLTR